MLALREELGDFARAIVRGETAARVISSYQNYSAGIAVDIYRNNYFGNLHDALAGAYPVARQLVGDDFFRFMARKFAECFPSRNGNLHHYGAEFPEFLTTFVPAQTLPYLADVAAMEWACHVAYFAEDVATFDVQKLAEIAPELYLNLQLILHPSCRVLRSRYPISEIWRAHLPGASCDFHIDLNSGSCIALVYRKDDIVQVEDIDENFADWLQVIQKGVSIGVASDAILARHADFDLSVVLRKLLAEKILVDIQSGAAT